MKIKLFILFFLTTLLSLFVYPTKVAAAPPSGFSTNLIISANLTNPTGFDISPDGRIFILEQTGNVRIYKNGQLLPTPFYHFDVNSTGDRGVLGVAFDPDFINNHFVYFYYSGADLSNYIARLDGTNDTFTSAPLILYATPPPTGLNHAGGTIRFGLDGKLYAGFGDNGYGPNAQDLAIPYGKVIRINKDGSIPADNPFVGQAGKLPEIWAYGLRNPFRFQFDSQNGDLLLGDVGQDTWEEIDKITKSGNYGWPNAEGNCTGCGYINPIYTYHHDTPSYSVTGGAVYRKTMFPQQYQGSYYFGDYARGYIKQMTFDSSGNENAVFDFDPSVGSIVDMKIASDGSIYYLTIFPGKLYKITYSTINQPPIVAENSDKTSGNSPLTVNFSSSGSSDPEGVTLNYSWDFGDGTTSTQANPQKIYNQKGKFNAQLTVSDGVNSSQALPITIQVGIPPNVSILSPLNSASYTAGESISYSSQATDSNNQTIVDSGISTQVIFHHSTHVHPFLNNLGKSGSFTIPQTGEPSADTYYEIIVTATDTFGLTTTKSITINPQKTTINIDSAPNGLQVIIDGQPQTTPQTILSVVNFKHELNASNQTQNNKYYEFDHWSDSQPKKHTITAPVSATTYVATFKELPPFAANYFNNKDLSGTPTLTRQDPIINFDWGGGSPDSTINSDNFSARWTKTENFNTGRYKFTTTTDDGVRLFIDNTQVINKWIDQGPTDYSAVLDVPTGNHTITMEYYDGTGGAVAKLNWDTTTDTPTILLPLLGSYSAEYFDNVSLTGSPILTKTDPSINFTWNNGSPDPLIPVDNFSARWTKTDTLTDGIYEFTTTADDGVRLYLDDTLILDKWIDQPSTTYKVDAQISAGNHTVKMEYYEHFGGAVAKMSYTKIAGFSAKYWNSGTGSKPQLPTSAPNLARQDDSINFTWNNSSPDPAINNDHFIVQWTKTMNLDGGSYQIDTTSDDGIRVYVDNQVVQDQWNDHPSTTFSQVQSFASGPHDIKVEYYENGGEAVAKFNIKKVAQAQTTFTGEYFDNKNLTGPPKITRQDAQINFDWGQGSPYPQLPVNLFSVRWTKTQDFTPGNYSFTLKSDDGVRFWIDNQLVVDDWTDHAMKTYSPNVTLTGGSHQIKVEYYENTGGAVAIFQQN